MAMRLYDGRGKPVALGRELGSGGEGAVLEVTHDPGLVAKVYHKAVAPEKVDKLEVMARIASPELLNISAWPTGTLHDKPNGELVGILQPRVANHREIHELYSPAQRKIYFPKADWSFLVHVAINLAAAFETVHHAGHVVGDVNPGGVFVSDRGTVKLIDCDSFQVRQNGRLYYCEVARLFRPCTTDLPFAVHGETSLFGEIWRVGRHANRAGYHRRTIRV
jgi:DNA-binding helix-hairpin-helix protein with protein kinase domain